MLPNKLQHGDSTARLFDLWNQLIDYLREIRLVAGNGIRINRLPAGTTIESTATAAGGGMSAPADTSSHPFDVEFTGSGPEYSARIVNSALPDSPYAGTVYIGSYIYAVPVSTVTVGSDRKYIDIVVTYNAENNPVYTVQLQTRSGTVTDPLTTFRQCIAEVKYPDIDSRTTDDIHITDRWV